MKEAQITDTILMVRPANFGFNEETAENNVFQDSDTDLSADEIKELARKEFDQLVLTLRNEGVNVLVIEDSEYPVKSDSVFPNNWISTHEDGRIYLFPMFSRNRRLERSERILKELDKQFDTCVDNKFLAYEPNDQFLEGTGSMILDRPNKIIYACYSERTNPIVLQAFADEIGYKLVGFDATDEDGIPYYHTNVIMTLGEHITIICTESIVDEGQRQRVIAQLLETGKEIVEISREQVLAFAGNMLEVKGSSSKNLMVMSLSAFNTLKESQLNIIKNHNKIVHSPLGTIEKFGGGSARCMMAEIFLPKNDLG